VGLQEGEQIMTRFDTIPARDRRRLLAKTCASIASRR